MVLQTLSKDLKIYIFLILLAIVGTIGGYFVGKHDGYDIGYNAGYKKGYAEALETITPVQKPKADTVQAGVAVQTTTTTTVRPKTQQEIASNAPSVVVETKPPVVTASVNGNKYEFKPQSEILQTGVRTTVAINIKVPERKWSVGIGVGKDKKPAYMLKAPIKGAVGAWVAGQNKHNIMGGISISF